MEWTLRKKLVVIMVSLSAAMILTMLAFNLYSERVLFASMEKRTRGLIESIHLAVGEITKKQPEAAGEALLSRIWTKRTEGISEINLIDASARITRSTRPENLGKQASGEITELLFQSESGQLVTKREHGYHVVIPVVAKGEHQGYIHLVLDIKDVTRTLEAHTREWIIATVVVLCLGILAAFFLSSHYTRPIREVVASAKSVAAGDLDVLLPVTERDEIGELKESFNQMIEKLAELRKLQVRLREAEHLSAVGELASSVAHEIRNPLNFISLSVDHLMDKQATAENTELLRNIKAEIRRFETLVRNFLTYGKPLQVARKSVMPLELIEQTLSLVNARAEKVGVRIVRDYGIEASMEISADPELLKTCIFNAILNAFEAMPGGGALTIAAAREGDAVAITIADTGTGIDEHLAEKVFEPFFTTRERGLGLGLAMTKRVIEGHDGKVAFSSVKGKGSRVRFVLPVNRS